MKNGIVNSFIILGLAVSFVSSAMMIFMLFNLGFVADRIMLTESNQLIAQLEALLAVTGFAANLFILRYTLKLIVSSS